MAHKRSSVIPGFSLTLGWTLFYLTLIVVLPLTGLLIETASLNWEAIRQAAFSPRALASYRLTFGASLIAAAVNTLFGGLVAWVLVRYRFPGKSLFDAVIDLPFALPTAVAGIAFTALYAETGWIGGLLKPLGVRAAFTPLGVVIVLIFIGLPFVVRTVQPVLEALEPELEDAAASLGAGRLQTLRRVILPTLRPALLTGFTMALARGIGEYGSVIFIAGNMPYKTEITPLLIVTRLEQYDYAGAAALGSVMLIISFLLLLTINYLQGRLNLPKPKTLKAD
ncbi:MAG: sulfate ABC transporter permease subunit CysT [candidate division KSB1 bacterium]|nr:sulfate ABC transporter permease subunit CysT [candidate division KSB1 bacterium]